MRRDLREMQRSLDVVLADCERQYRDVFTNDRSVATVLGEHLGMIVALATHLNTLIGIVDQGVDDDEVV